MIAALINHLWLSTLFALGSGLLALALRRARAGVRYGLWFAASAKFLIPFALLTAAGDVAAARLHVTAAPPQAFTVIAPVIDPLPSTFMDPRIPPHASVPPTAPAIAAPARTAAPVRAAALDLRLVVLAVWVLGLIAVLSVWIARWSRVRAALDAASPLDWPASALVLSSPVLMEPGVAGLWRPVLLLPEGIAERLSPAELDAVIAHELCHIRRRDNVTAALHMLVQALFWFHPLVWWLGTRLVAEREQACDEAVVRAGHDREAYARGILETCRHYLQSPLACAPGVSGSDLTKRVEAIMTHPESAPLSLAAKALLGGAAALALASPVAAGILAAQKPAELALPPAPSMGAVAPPAAVKVVAPATASVAPADPAAVQPADSEAVEAPKPIVVAEAQAPAPVSPPSAASAPNPSQDEIARRLAEQQQPRTVVPFDPAHFDRYVGDYQLGPNQIFKITRDGSKFYSQLTGQPSVEIYPESETKFFYTVVAAQISFTTDAKGAVTGLVLHQGGRELPAPRVDEAQVKAAEAALAQRIAANKPAPGTEAIVRKVLDSLQAGTPDYSFFKGGLAQVARSQEESLVMLAKGWGPINTIQFGGVTPQGLDRYVISSHNAVFAVVVSAPDADGKVNGFAFIPYMPTP